MLILDATCAGRQIWEDKARADVIYIDRRVVPRGTIPIRPNWCVKPDVCADFTALPFADATFDAVVWDPPHIVRTNPSSSYLRTKYGELNPNTWRDVLWTGFEECWRVLREPGFLYFKWATSSIALEDVLDLFSVRPLFRNKHDVTWSIYAKPTPRLSEATRPHADLFAEVS